MPLEVLINQDGIERYLTPYITSLEYSGSYNSVCRQIQVEIAYGIYSNGSIPRIEIEKGKTPIYIRDMDAQGNFKKGLFSGVVINGTKEKDKLTLTAWDYAYFLKNNETKEGMECANAEQVTKELCNKFGLNTTYLYPTNIQLTMLVAPQPIYDTIMGMYTEASKQTGEKYYLIADYYNNISVAKVGNQLCPKVITPCTGDLNVADGNLISITETTSGDTLVNQCEIYDDSYNLVETMDIFDQYPPEQYGIISKSYQIEEGLDYRTVVKNTILHGIDKTYELEMKGDYNYWSGCSSKLYVPWIDELDKQSDGSIRTVYITSDTHTWDMTTDSYTTKLNVTLVPIMDEKELQDARQKNSKGGKGSGTVVKKALKWAKEFADDNSHGYELGGWGNPDIDCSHFVITAYRQAGLSLANASYTGDMKNAFTQEGFEVITSWDKENGTDLIEGDVLVNEANHTEMYYGNGQNIGAHTNRDNKPGDSSGTEVYISNYNNYPWDYVLRYTVSDSEDTSEDATGEEIMMDLSFYTGAKDEGGNMSASSKTLQYGMCASNVYPFGTQFKITGISGLEDRVFTVEDRGGADFNSNTRLDIYVGNDKNAKKLANQLGRQKCKAYRLN